MSAAVAPANPSPDESLQPLALTWQHLNLAISGSSILTDVSGVAAGGEVCCIMGSSGAGKTSLLSLLAGRYSTTGDITTSGAVAIGGVVIDPVEYKRSIAYVMQDDALVPTSTPREALSFSVALRLGVDESERASLVDKMLCDLNLSDCADTFIGSALVKGVSGGERKRTSVGVELIIKPRLLFLDEPTSGLDSESALSCVKLLGLVASKGATVLTTIHQPSSKIFSMFNSLVLMSSGRVLQQGQIDAVMNAFETAGFAIPQHHNPADFIMDVATNCSQTKLRESGLLGTNELNEFEPADQTCAEIPVLNAAEEKQANFWMQMRWLVLREGRAMIRDKKALTGRFATTIFLNVLFGMIFFNAGGRDRASSTNLNSHFGALTMVTISSMFGTAQPVILSFPLERPIFLREYSTGTYSPMAYFLSKAVVELPLAYAQALVQYLIIYFLLDLQGGFFSLVAAAWALGVASSSVAVLLGCSAADVRTAAEITPVAFVPQLLFAGFFVRISQIPSWLRWPQYLCALKYALNLICLIEFTDCEPNSSNPLVANANCESLLSENDIHEGDHSLYLLVLLVLFLVFRTFGAIVLTRRAQSFY